MTDDQIAALLGGITKALEKVGEGQEKIVAKLDAIGKSPLAIDPSKLSAKTEGVVPTMRSVESARPVLTEPNPRPDIPRPCWRCNTMYNGNGQHCKQPV